MGKMFKIISWIVVLIVIYIWFSTVLKSCGDNPVTDGIEQVSETTDGLMDEAGELIGGEDEDQFEGEDIDYTEDDGDSDFEEVEEIIEEEVVEDTPPPTRYTQTTNSTSGNSSGQYMLIAGNYLVQSNAGEMRKKLQNLGFSDAEVARFDNSQYHTVIASRYTDYGTAVRSSSDLKAKGIDCYVKRRT